MINQSGRSQANRTVSALGSGGPADIVELIMADHRRIGRMRDAVRDVARWADDAGSDWVLARVWQRLTDLLMAHFAAEEEICYLPMFGPGPHAAERRRDAVADHDDIRAAVCEASLRPVGSALWWRAVGAALTASVEHLDREESGVLPGCLTRLTMSRRLALGRQWSAFTAAWAQDATVPAERSSPAAEQAAGLRWSHPSRRSDRA